MNSGQNPRSEVRLDLSDPVLNQRRVFVVSEITEASAAETIRQLLYLDAGGPQPIQLLLMTPGGDLQAAFAVVRTMQTLRSPVNTIALGECNSGGAVLLAAGTGQRQAFADGTIVLHGMQVRGGPPARYVELTQEAYTAFWKEHARLPEAWLPLPPGKTHVLSAKEALEHGVIDTVLPKRESGHPARSGFAP